ncbi:MAG: HAMP domain-containing histidine kinase, partial [Gammaproteobacteria bacterium]|nr:HAMP domain-containing histidine kinase [Gammaproteobacteria bacterium]NIU06545.1 HAMP domain-containing histidine kinase [Gammaproteobacteria bacterium]NIV53434.1 two-component sensor histidine kinase [Gammaproteobacteria bacterium]NIW85412.1 two-component sensor histidine kinase [Gammaproteobacteria bacterium]NIX87818.1 two-component sensor histidine kinase [Gammaproteobacteria bacterium]
AHEPGEYREAIEQAISEADGLLKTFRALLAIAQIEAGTAGKDWAAVNLADLVTDVTDLYEAAAEAQGLEFVSDVAPGIEVGGNRHLLAQALGNLLDNAIKYTPQGGRVELAAKRVDGAPVLVVSDSGPGISLADRKRVQERFARLDSARTTP